MKRVELLLELVVSKLYDTNPNVLVEMHLASVKDNLKFPEEPTPSELFCSPDSRHTWVYDGQKWNYLFLH